MNESFWRYELVGIYFCSGNDVEPDKNNGSIDLSKFWSDKCLSNG